MDSLISMILGDTMIPSDTMILLFKNAKHWNYQPLIDRDLKKSGPPSLRRTEQGDIITHSRRTVDSISIV